jgi:hypothetical protein
MRAINLQGHGALSTFHETRISSKHFFYSFLISSCWLLYVFKQYYTTMKLRLILLIFLLTSYRDANCEVLGINSRSRSNYRLVLPG